MTTSSGARLEVLRPDRLTPAQRALYDAVVGGPRGAGPQAFPLVDGDGGLAGPFNAFLLAPQIGQALQAVGAAIRYGGRLTGREREIAVLRVATRHDCAFERYAHEAVGRQVGLTDDELRSLRERDTPAVGDDRERLVATTTDRLLADGDLDDAAYAAAVEALGEAVLFELLTLVGYYGTLALQLRVFRVGVPGD